jgi:hypothetical protein
MHWEAEPFYWLGNLARKLRGNHCGKFSDNKIHCVRSVRIIVAISWRCDCAATLLYFIVQPDPGPDNQFFARVLFLARKSHVFAALSAVLCRHLRRSERAEFNIDHPVVDHQVSIVCLHHSLRMGL